jgi:hypothetical protein
MAQQARPLQNTEPERFASYKYSSLLGSFQVMKKLNVVNVAPGTIFSALHFFITYKWGPIS